MPTYVSLVNFTDQGIKNIKGTTERANAFKQLANSLGVEVKAFYYTSGRYDIITITEAPDTVTASALALTVGALGNVRTEALEAFSIEEMGEIVAKMP